MPPATLAVLGILGSVAGVVVVFGRGLRSRGGPPVVVVGSWWVISTRRLNEGNEKKCKIHISIPRESLLKDLWTSSINESVLIT